MFWVFPRTTELEGNPANNKEQRKTSIYLWKISSKKYRRCVPCFKGICIFDLSERLEIYWTRSELVNRVKLTVLQAIAQVVSSPTLLGNKTSTTLEVMTLQIKTVLVIYHTGKWLVRKLPKLYTSTNNAFQEKFSSHVSQAYIKGIFFRLSYVMNGRSAGGWCKNTSL